MGANLIIVAVAINIIRMITLMGGVGWMGASVGGLMVCKTGPFFRRKSRLYAVRSSGVGL